MKKFLCVIVAIFMLFSFCACSAESNEEDDKDTNTTQSESEAQTAGESVDLDLTTLSSTMIYSEVYNMINTPSDYMGKTVKMEGDFSVYEDVNGNEYFAVLIADATACCSQGIEFVLDGDYTYPEDYPELGTDITVTGTFGTYEEDDYTYCQLTGAQMTVNS